MGLHELADAGILKGERGEGYQLTKHGKDLLLAMAPVHSWALAWARRQRA